MDATTHHPSQPSLLTPPHVFGEFKQFWPADPSHCYRYFSLEPGLRSTATGSLLIILSNLNHQRI